MVKRTEKAPKSEARPRETGPKDLLPAAQKVYDDQFIEYIVEARILTRIVGGTPRRLETTFAMIDSRVKSGKLTTEEAETIKQSVVQKYGEMSKKKKGEDVTEDPESLSAAASALESNWNTFWLDENGFYLETRTIKAAIRASLSTLNVFTKNPQQRKRVGHNDGTYIEGLGPHIDRVYLTRQGYYIAEADEYEDRVVLLKTAKGPMSARKRIDIVWGDEMNSPEDAEAYDKHELEYLPYECVLQWKYKVLKSCSLTEDDIVKGLALLKDRGLGAMTSQGFGRFELQRFERL